MRRRRRTALHTTVRPVGRTPCTALCVAATALAVSAQEVLLREGGSPPPDGTFAVPFGFYSDSLGIEVGRVADEFRMEELHSGMNLGGLLGIRAMVNTLVVRADMGITDEGMAVQMIIDQPF